MKRPLGLAALLTAAIVGSQWYAKRHPLDEELHAHP
jgi:hypothetical protein